MYLKCLNMQQFTNILHPVDTLRCQHNVGINAYICKYC